MPPYTWALASASPNSGSWLSLSSSGLLTGTPGTIELELLNIRVTDANGRVGTSPFQLFVVAGGSLVTNGQSVTSTGTGYGAKSRGLAPLLDEDAAGPGWSVLAPNTGNALYIANNMKNRALNFNPSGANVGAPHPFLSAIAAGAHYTVGVEAWLVYLSLGFTIPAFPFTIYASWWELCDPLWAFLGTFNIKQAAYSYSDGIPGDCIYIGVNPAITSNLTATTQLTTNENTIHQSTLENPDRNGHNAFWGSQPSPFYLGAGNGVWIFKEMEICADIATGPSGKGFWRIYVNGVRIVNYAGRTDSFTPQSATHRNVTIGPCVYSGQYGPPNATQNNWGYTAGHYIDVSGGNVSGHCARATWGDQPTKAASTKLANAIVTAWSGTQVVSTFRQGPFILGQTVYLHIDDESGVTHDNQLQRTVA